MSLSRMGAWSRSAPMSIEVPRHDLTWRQLRLDRCAHRRWFGGPLATDACAGRGNALHVTGSRRPLELAEHGGVPRSSRRAAGDQYQVHGRALGPPAHGYGAAATERHTSADELEAVQAELRQSLPAGPIGFSSSWSGSHKYAEGVPAPSRHAAPDELVTLASVCREFAGTSLEFVPSVRVDRSLDMLSTSWLR
jgi:hypothetical protein